MSLSKHPLLTFDRKVNAVDQARRVSRKTGTPVYSFLIGEHFYNVLEAMPEAGNWAGNFAFKNIKRCFSDLYYHYPDSFIGCYDENANRQWMIDDFYIATQESVNGNQG